MRIDRHPSESFNWTESDTTYPAVEVFPETEDHLVAIVRGTEEEFPSPVRAVGHLHSTNACISTHVPGTHEPRGTLVRMEKLAWIDPPFKLEGSDVVYVRAGAGARLIDIKKKLSAVGRELSVSPEIGNATIGSVACGGTKDSTLKPRDPHTQGISQVSSLVVEAKYVDASGNKIQVSETGAKLLAGNAPLLLPDIKKFRSSYGLFGIVYEVTLRTVPKVLLETSYDWIQFRGGKRSKPEDIPTVDEVFGDAATVLGFLQPYRPGVLAERRTIATDQDVKPSKADRVRRALRDWIWEWGASAATTAAEKLAKFDSDPRAAVRGLLSTAILAAVSSTADNPLKNELLGENTAMTQALLTTLRDALQTMDSVPPEVTAPLTAVWKKVTATAPVTGSEAYDFLISALDLAPEQILGAIGGFKSYRSDSLIDFVERPLRDAAFDFTFWLFPIDEWPRIISAYLNFCQDIVESRPDVWPFPSFRPALFTQVYFMGQDESSLLSPCPGGPAFTLDVAHTASVQRDEWRRFNEAYNVWAAKNHGRPLLNQTKWLESTPDVKNLLAGIYGTNVWKTFSTLVRAANPPRAKAPNGRFVSDFFQQLLP
jgi:hypothetical protein